MRKIMGLIAVIVVVLGIAAYVGLRLSPSTSVRAGLDLALQRLPPGWKATYRSVDYDTGSDRIAVKGVEFHQAGESKLDGTIDEIDIAGLPVDLGTRWSEAAANPGAAAPDMAVPIAGTIAVKGIALDLAGQTLKIGAADIAKLHLYPWALLHGGIPAYHDVASLIARPAAEQKPEDAIPVLRYLASYVMGIGADAVTAQDIASSTETPVKADYRLKQLEVAKLDRGRVETVRLNGIASKQGAQIDFNIAQIAVTGGLDLRTALTKVLTDPVVDPSLLDGVTLGQLQYSGITINLPSSKPATLGRATLSNFTIAHGMVASADIAVEGFKLRAAELPNENLQQAFGKLGLDSATLSFGAGYKWNAEKKTAALDQVRVKIDELAELSLSADFAGVDAGDAPGQKPVLSHAVLHYVDASLASRALKAGAADNETAPGQFAVQIAGFVQAQSVQFLGDTPEVAAIDQAITSFLTDPHSLTIELAPPVPVELASLEANPPLPPAELFAKLGAKVTANN